MIDNSLLNEYEEVRECDYRDEHYSVRDNGAVLRHAPKCRKPRKYDNVWTFGKVNVKNGYLYLASVRVHQIVSTAFHGAPEVETMVVDHIDTNRQNNRPENLRWITRLENSLNNAATRKKIAFYCGSIENFLKNPSMLRERCSGQSDIEWMGNVSKEDAERAMRNVREWSKSENSVFYDDEQPKERKGSFGDIVKGVYGEDVRTRVFKLLNDDQKRRRHRGGSSSSWYGLRNSAAEEQQVLAELIDAKSPSTAVQRNWKTKTEFLLCPSSVTETALQDYFSRLKKSAIISKNDYSKTEIVDFEMVDEGSKIVVLGRLLPGIPMDWALMAITVENGRFVHESISIFHEEKGGQKYFTLACGREWTGGDCIDDLC